MRIITIMAILCLLLILLGSVLLTGCGSSEPAAMEEPEPVILREEQMPGPEEVVVVKPEEATADEMVDLDEKPQPEEKQLETGASTDITEEKLTLLSDVNCTFEDKAATGFAFTMTNIEEKEWALSAISYSEREKFNNPIVAVNALQVTNSQLIESCGGKSRIKPGQTVDCVFDLADVSNVILRKSLRTGETALGNYNANTISLRTPDHAAETTFWC